MKQSVGDDIGSSSYRQSPTRCHFDSHSPDVSLSGLIDMGGVARE